MTALLLASAGCLAQRVPSAAAPPPTPAPAADAAQYRGTGLHGRYQTPDGRWHAARVHQWRRDRVYLGEPDRPDFRPYFPSEVKRFVVGPDTMAAVQHFVLPKGRGQLVAQGFARQLLRQGEYRLYQYDHSENPSPLTALTAQVMLLRRGAEPLQVVPTRARAYRAWMLAQFGACPAVARQLRTGAARPWRDTPQLLATYVSWQTQTAAAAPVSP
ncbi:hypothetical protein [Hymenobacter sp. B81]|uniref:hypothetical protein n=1 Tax=Hymenobacter sp. B81 TaxID=3344878 RepID=UPI0037DD15E4